MFKRYKETKKDKEIIRLIESYGLTLSLIFFTQLLTYALISNIMSNNRVAIYLLLLILTFFIYHTIRDFQIILLKQATEKNLVGAIKYISLIYSIIIPIALFAEDREIKVLGLITIPEKNIYISIILTYVTMIVFEKIHLKIKES